MDITRYVLLAEPCQRCQKLFDREELYVFGGHPNEIVLCRPCAHLLWMCQNVELAGVPVDYSQVKGATLFEWLDGLLKNYSGEYGLPTLADPWSRVEIAEGDLFNSFRNEQVFSLGEQLVLEGCSRELLARGWKPFWYCGRLQWFFYGK